MPDRRTIEKARRDKREGKSVSTQAGEFVRSEIEKIRRGEHGVRSAKQAIAIGLSEARRAGVDLKPPKPGKTSEKTRRNAERAYALGHGAPRKQKVSRKRSRASAEALKRESTDAASPEALGKQAREAASRRTAAERSAAAKKAVRTKGPAGRKRAAEKASKTKAKKRTGRR